MTQFSVPLKDEAVQFLTTLMSPPSKAPLLPATLLRTSIRMTSCKRAVAAGVGTAVLYGRCIGRAERARGADGVDGARKGTFGDEKGDVTVGARIDGGTTGNLGEVGILVVGGPDKGEGQGSSHGAAGATVAS